MEEGDLVSGGGATVGGNDIDGDEGACLGGGWIAEVRGDGCV